MNGSAPLRNAYAEAGATLASVGGMETGARLPPLEHAIYLADLSPLPRTLLLGTTTPSVLTAAGLPAPSVMQVAPLAGGGFVACRAPRQFLYCSGQPPAMATFGAETPTLAFDGIDFAIGGGAGANGVGDLLAEACTTDLTQFSTAAWIPTLLYGVEVAIWRVSDRDGGHFRIVGAPADGEFLAKTLLQAVRARHGALTGFNDYFELQR